MQVKGRSQLKIFAILNELELSKKNIFCTKISLIHPPSPPHPSFGTNVKFHFFSIETFPNELI